MSMDNGATGDVYGRHMHMQDQEKIERRRRRRAGYTNQWRLEIQNVRGFVEENRRRWMETWRRTPRQEVPLAWMIQETHVSTFTEAEKLKADWRRLWGRSHQSDSKPLSYWSIDDSKRGGVAILLHPSVVDQVSPWLQERWTRRVIAIKMRERTLVNVYAPNSHEEREQFFGRLQA
ncbi:hypothetical protein F441_05186 [Phytophthora nicotianae CJ01A1]|uniref:Uncharacterized protein n=1 Tax=Phytophthora nicotianae CJ01A1 TaxID=1317063 RepID=W2XGZ9_PHYNI|nr:hypothetical protein F441_05186 [Phytophthora nicotianae CJ01A1]